MPTDFPTVSSNCQPILQVSLTTPTVQLSLSTVNLLSNCLPTADWLSPMVSLTTKNYKSLIQFPTGSLQLSLPTSNQFTNCLFQMQTESPYISSNCHLNLSLPFANCFPTVSSFCQPILQLSLPNVNRLTPTFYSNCQLTQQLSLPNCQPNLHLSLWTALPLCQITVFNCHFKLPTESSTLPSARWISNSLPKNWLSLTVSSKCQPALQLSPPTANWLSPTVSFKFLPTLSNCLYHCQTTLQLSLTTANLHSSTISSNFQPTFQPSLLTAYQLTLQLSPPTTNRINPTVFPCANWFSTVSFKCQLNISYCIFQLSTDFTTISSNCQLSTAASFNCQLILSNCVFKQQTYSSTFLQTANQLTPTVFSNFQLALQLSLLLTANCISPTVSFHCQPTLHLFLQTVNWYIQLSFLLPSTVSNWLIQLPADSPTVPFNRQLNLFNCLFQLSTDTPTVSFNPST